MHLPQLILDLAVILGVAAVVTYVFRLIRQPVVLGYIVAGIIVGPHTPPIFSVTEMQSINIWAELGVIFLMFALGLEFSFRRLARVGLAAVATALLQIGTMFMLGLFAAEALGWHGLNGPFLGCMVAISSTTIIIKALDELGLKSKRFAELVFGILVVEDLAAILMLVGLTSIAKQSNVNATDLMWAAGRLVLLVGVWLFVGIKLVPHFIRAVAKKGNDEMMVVVAIGLCLGMVALSASFHYSAALGAFIMGSILAETQEVHRIESLVNPLKDVFGAVFFVSIGMMLDPLVIQQNFVPILGLSLLIIIGKFGSVTAGSLLTRQGLRSSLASGLSMAQIGEFSFIIANLGLALEVIEPKIFPIIVAASLITTFTTPYLMKAGPFLIDQAERWFPPSPVEPTSKTQSALIPWEAHISTLRVHPNSLATGRPIMALKLRERFGINIVAIQRGEVRLVAPSASELLYPHDLLQCCGEDEGLELARKEIETERPIPLVSEVEGDFQLAAYDVAPSCPLIGQTLVQSQLGERYAAVVVGAERNGQRLLNPQSTFTIERGDRLWIAGDHEHRAAISQLLEA